MADKPRTWEEVVEYGKNYEPSTTPEPAPAAPAAPAAPTELAMPAEPKEQRSWAEVMQYGKTQKYAYGQPDVITPELGSTQSLSFWLKPENLAKAKRMIDISLANDVPLPSWLDPEIVLPAYSYLEEKNGSKNWWTWNPIGDDPIGNYLGMLDTPPPGESFVPQMQQTNAEQLYPPGTEAIYNNFDELPGWQSVAATVMDSPYLSSVGNMLPWSVMGAIAGLPAGPVGATIGFLTPMAMALTFGFLGDEAVYNKLRSDYGEQGWIDTLQNIATGTLGLLNLPTEIAERTFGTISYVGAAALDPKTYGSLESVLKNLDAVWDVGLLTYEASSPKSPLQNIPAGAEWLWDMVAHGETDVRFAPVGYVHVLGQAEPVKVDAYGLAAINLARQEVMKGRAPAEVVAEFQEKFAFSGAFTDLIAQSVMDPLNYMGPVERKAVSKYGKLTNNMALVKAAELAKGEGAVGTYALYGDLLAQGYGPHYTAMTPHQRSLAGINELGEYKKLLPEGNKSAEDKKKLLNWSMNPFDIRGIHAFFTDMTPSSKYKEVVGMAHENIGELLNQAESPEQMIELVKAWVELPPEEAANVAEMLDLPDAITVKSALQEAGPMIAEMEAEYMAGQPYRQFVAELSEITGMGAGEIVKGMRESKGDAFVKRIVSKAGIDPANYPNLNAKFVESAAAWFKTKPYHPDHFRAILHNNLLDVVSQWGIKAYKVEPSKPVDRFFMGLKSIQSLLLLGLNVKYKINNDVGNTVTRVADGLWGPANDATINAFFNELGIEPYRLRAGLGAADIGVDVDIAYRGEEKVREYFEEGGVFAAEQVGMAESEAAVRSAMKGKDWTQTWADWAGKVGNIGPMTKWAGKAEQKAGAQTMYLATKKYWDRAWNRKADIPRMPLELENGLMAIDSRLPGAVYALLENAHNAEQINNVYKALSDESAVLEAEADLATLKASYTAAAKAEAEAKRKAASAEAKAREEEAKVMAKEEAEKAAASAEAKALASAQAEKDTKDKELIAKQKQARLDEEAKEKTVQDQERARREQAAEEAKQAAEAAGRARVESEQETKRAEEAAKRAKAEAEQTPAADAEAARLARLEAEQLKRDAEKARLAKEAVYKQMKEKELIAKGLDLSADEIARIAAEQLGLDHGDVKEMLEDTRALEIINEALRKGQSIDDAIYAAEQHHRSAVDDKLRDDLINRSGEVATKVEAEGFIEALDIFKDLQIKQAELWGRHFAEWQRTFDLSKLSDTKTGAALKRMTMSLQDAEWKRHRLWEVSTWTGVLDALGYGSSEGNVFGLNKLATEYILTITAMHESWNEFYARRSKMYRETFTKLDTMGNVERAKKDAVWRKMQEDMGAMYDEYVAAENTYNQKLGAKFMEMWADQYGVGKTMGIAEWWKAIIDTTIIRQNLMKDFRAWERGTPVDQMAVPEVIELVSKYDYKNDKDRVWTRFLNELYLPAIGRGIKAGLDGAWNVFQNLRDQPISDLDKRWLDSWDIPERDVEADAKAYYDESMAKLADEKVNALAALSAKMAKKRNLMAKDRPDLFARRVFEGKESVDGVDPRYLAEINKEIKRLQDDADWLAKANTGLYGPRHRLTAENYPGYPEWFYPLLQDHLLYAAQSLREQALIGGVESVQGQDGGYFRVSSNPQWYIDLYNAGYNKDMVVAALDRIILGEGKDEIKSGSVTLPEIKKEIVRYAGGENDAAYETIVLFEAEKIWESIDKGDWESACRTWDIWINGPDTREQLTYADKLMIVGGENNLTELTLKYMDWLEGEHLRRNARAMREERLEEKHAQALVDYIEAEEAAKVARDMANEFKGGLDELQAVALQQANEKYMTKMYGGEPDWEAGVNLFYERLRSKDIYGAIDIYSRLAGKDYNTWGLTKMWDEGFIKIEDGIITEWNTDVEFPLKNIESRFDNPLDALDFSIDKVIVDTRRDTVKIYRIEDGVIYSADGRQLSGDDVIMVLNGKDILYVKPGYTTEGANVYNVLPKLREYKLGTPVEPRSDTQAEFEARRRAQGKEPYESRPQEGPGDLDLVELGETRPLPEAESVTESEPTLGEAATKIKEMEAAGVRLYNWKDRASRRQGLIDLFKMDEPIADAEMALLDELARVWGVRHGLAPERFWDNLVGLQGDTDDPGGLKQAKRGAYLNVDDGKRLIVAMQQADADTFLHEMAHYFFDYAMTPELMEAVLKFAGETALTDENYVKVQEIFAEGYVAWRSYGYAPTNKLRIAFDKFRYFLRSVLQKLYYQGLIGVTQVPIPKDYDAMYGRLFAYEIHELTLGEFQSMPDIDWTVQNYKREHYDGEDLDRYQFDRAVAHSDAVEEQLKRGGYVSERVLADYPNLLEQVAKRLDGGDVVPHDVATWVDDVEITEWTAVKLVQKGKAEATIGNLFARLGISEEVGKPGYYRKVRVKGYQDLVIETHDYGDYQKIYLSHYRTENGDYFIDAEMVYRLNRDGILKLEETATIGFANEEHRGLDKVFANMFSRNLIDQGFGEGELFDPRAGSQSGSYDDTAAADVAGSEQAIEESAAQPMAEAAMSAAEPIKAGLPIDELIRSFIPFVDGAERKAFEQFAKSQGLDLNKEADMNLAYDALEGAFNLRARELRAEFEANNTPLAERLKALNDLELSIVKARRTAGKMELQQFSTPITISEAAGWAANVRPGDVILEPTAGTGNLIDKFFGRDDVTLLANEIDAGRGAVLRGLGYSPSGVDLMGADWVMTPEGKIRPPIASVVITNPPWGAYSTGKYGTAPKSPVKLNDWSQRFTNLIIQRMPWGGRLVGVMPTNWVYTRNRKSDNIVYKDSAYLKHLESTGIIRAIIESPPNAYDGRATNVGSLLVVYDHGTYYSMVEGYRQDQSIPIKAYGDNAPKNWDEYAALVERVTRTDERYKQALEGLVEHEFTTTGPDSGITDPAARRGDNVRDPARIGKPLGAGDASTRTGDAGRVGDAAGDASARAGDAGRAGDTGGPGRSDAAGAGSGEPGRGGRAARAGEPAAGKQLGLGDAPTQDTEGGGLAPYDASGPAGVHAGRGLGASRDIGDSGGDIADGFAMGATRTRDDVGEADDGRRGGDTRLVDGEPDEIPTGTFEQRYSLAFRERLQKGRDGVRNSGSFAEYVARSDVTHYHPHPTIVVETKSLSGVKYPKLEAEYQPSAWVMDAVRRRVLSVEGNLDPIWAAAQQNDKYGSGILVADDVGMGKSRTAAGFVLDRIEKGKKRILVVTKGNNNVSNLMDNEFPTVYAGVANETGYVADVPNTFPAERIWLKGETYPEVKKGQEAIPTFAGPAVYFISSTQLADFSRQIIDLKVDAVIVDEVHEFKNTDTKRSVAWVALHENWLNNNASFLYLSATPGMDIAELKYLYGLRVWHMKGFDDWIGIITGKKTVEQVRKEQAAHEADSNYVSVVQDYLDTKVISDETKTVRVNWKNQTVKGKTIGEYFVFKSAKDSYMVIDQGQGQRVAVGMSQTEALLKAALLSEGVAPHEVYNMMRKRFPVPDTESGPKDSSDIMQKVAKSWGKKGLSAWDRTISTAHTEQIMRELKQSGHYMSRDISRAGVEFTVKEILPDHAQLTEYDRRVSIYREIYKAFREFGGYNEGPKARAAMFGVSGDIQADNKRALFNMRFKNVVAEAQAAIARGEKVVISVVSVGESKDGGGPLNSALSKINTKKVEKEGKSYSEPEDIPEALIRVAELREKLAEFEAMPSPVDMLKEVFQGRFGYITGQVSDKVREQYRKAFQRDALDVILISGAGKTGLSLHDISGKRVHLIVADYEWSSTVFKQELGRVDRTGQLTSPFVTILHSGTASERKFVSTIANRMKGLGALSKGAEDSTGTGALTDEFELGSGLDKAVLAQTWSNLTIEQREYFLDHYFADLSVPNTQKSIISPTSESLNKFLLGLQTVPRDEGNIIWDQFVETRRLMMENLDNQDDAKALKMKGEILRVTEVGNAKITEVKAENGDVYGIVGGTLTPIMNTIKKAVTGGQIADNWMRWYQFYDVKANEYISGLYLRQSHIRKLADALGAKILTGYTPDNALRYMQAGEKIPVRGVDGNAWQLYIGQGGNRDGRIVVGGAKIGQRQALMTNGAELHPAGAFFFVEEKNLANFLYRFPIDNDADVPERPRALYQMSADGKPEPTEETKRYAQAKIPDKVTVMKLPVPFEVDGHQVTGFAFKDGDFLAYIPANLKIGKLVDTGEFPSRLIGVDGKGNWVFIREKSSQDTVLIPMTPEPMRLAGPLAMGTTDATAGTFYHSEVMDDGWSTRLRPVLAEMSKVGHAQPEMMKSFRGKMGSLSPELKMEMRRYLGKVKQEQSKTKLAALRVGERRRDQALLNYSKRSPIDGLLQMIFPYQFWYTRSTANWALRILDRPALLAFYARLANFADQDDEKKDIPTRLLSKTRLPASYLPEWAGGGLWVDPMGKLFPFAEFLRPFDRMMQENNLERKRAESLLRKQGAAGAITLEEMNEAIAKRSGEAWDSAMKESQEGKDVMGEVFDYMSLFISPAAYLQIPANLMSGKHSGPMPMSSFIQGLSAATGIQGLENLDVEGRWNKSRGLSEFGEWGDWYIDRQIANMAADDPSITKQAVEAMITKQGEIYDEAKRRVQMEIAMRQPFMNTLYAGRQAAGGLAGASDIVGSLLFSWLPANMLPTGELKLRGLEDEYYDAWRKYHEGDKEAINHFFAEHPEYEARLALYDEPEERMRQFLISEVWERYTEMDTLQKRATADGLGRVFNEQFLNTETRDYDSLSVETLASWAKTMGGGTAGIETVEQGGVNWVDEDLSKGYEAYLAERKKLFPNIGAIMDLYYQSPTSTQYAMKDANPKLQEYWNWRDMYIASHPELIPYVIGEENKLTGAPAGVAELVYQYKGMKAQLFPNISQLESEYYALSSERRAAYRREHPEIDAYYQWQKQWFAANPTAIPYIASTEKIAKAVLGKDFQPMEAKIDVSTWSPLLTRQLGNYFQGGALTSGARSMLLLEYERTGGKENFGSFDEWLDSLRYLNPVR